MRVVRFIVLLCLASCSATLPTYETRFTSDAVSVPVAEFERSPFIIASDDTAPFDVLIVKESPTAFHSLGLKCSFDGKPLDVTPDELVCPVCGSMFSFDGAIKKGPAETDLVKLPTELNPNETNVRVNIKPIASPK
jgi:hypothetical protein